MLARGLAAPEEDIDSYLLLTPAVEIANDFAYAHYGKAVIDGEVDSIWESFSAIPISTQVDYKTEPAEPADFFGFFQALWDEDGIYLLIKVVDDQLLFSKGSSIELFFSTSYTRRWGGWSEFGYNFINDTYLILKHDEDPLLFRHGFTSWKGSWDTEETAEGVVFELSTITAKRYLAEIFIPWETINPANEISKNVFYGEYGVFLTPLKDGNSSRYAITEFPIKNFIGFEVFLSDSDNANGVTDNMIAWSGGQGSYTRARLATDQFGTLILKNENVEKLRAKSFSSGWDKEGKSIPTKREFYAYTFADEHSQPEWVGVEIITDPSFEGRYSVVEIEPLANTTGVERSGKVVLRYKLTNGWTNLPPDPFTNDPITVWQDGTGFFRSAKYTIGYDQGWKWNGLGFIWEGAWPFVYILNSDSWIYLFQEAYEGEATSAKLAEIEETGAYLYDFNTDKFGYLITPELPDYWLWDDGWILAE